MLTEDDLTAIRHIRFNMDCLRIALRKQSGGPEKFVGGGTIRQTSEGTLECVIYDTTTTVEWEDIHITVGAGEWLSAEHFWILTATDLHGRTWTAEWVDIDTSTHSEIPGAIVTATFRELTHRDPVEISSSGFRGIASTPVRLPVNAYTENAKTVAGEEFKGFKRNIWKVESATLGRMLATELDDGIDVNVARKETRLPPGFPARLEEAFTFVLSSPIYWLAEQMVSEGELTVVIRNRRLRLSGRPRLSPPLEPRTSAGFQHCGEMFDRFVAFSLNETIPNDGRYTSLALMVFKVLRASSGVIEDEALALGTEVERLVRERYFDSGQAPASVRAAVASVLEHLAKWVGPPEMRQRFEGSINQITGTNVRTALNDLVSDGVITRRHLDAWVKTRNTAAHGLGSSSSGREQVALNDVVHQLFVLLVLNLIGYAGAITDHTTKGFPVAASPIALVQAATPVTN